MGSGGQLGLYSEYFAAEKIGRRRDARENDLRKTAVEIDDTASNPCGAAGTLKIPPKKTHELPVL